MLPQVEQSDCSWNYSNDNGYVFAPFEHHPLHEPDTLESSGCTRPQMAWQMYERLLRIAEQQTPREVTPSAKDIWIAAFTGCTLRYQAGAPGGADVAEKLF